MLSCSGNTDSTAQMDGIDMDSAVAKASCPLIEEPNSPKCEISLNVQYAKGRNAEVINEALISSGIVMPDYIPQTSEKMSVRQVVDSFAMKYTADYVEFYSDMYRNDKSHPELYNAYYHLTTESQSNRKGILTYLAHIRMYAGGEHETRQTIVKNVRLTDAKVLSLQDLFIHGYEHTLKKMLTEKLCRRFDVDDIDGLKAKTVFADGDIYISDNFIIGKDKLTFIYCENEIAPHAMGEIRIDIDNDDMGRLWKDTK